MRVSKAVWWLALIAIAVGAAIAANVALLDVAEHQDDPVGKLSRRVLVATDGQGPPPSPPTVTTSTEPTVTASTAPPANTEPDGRLDGEDDD